MLHRFKAGYEHYLGIHGDDHPPRTTPEADAEHRAVLDLLVATMFVDGTVTEQELREIDQYGDEQGWNGLTFSFVQGMGAATEKVRNARSQAGGIEELLAEASAAITSPDVRSTVAAACRRVAQADGTTDDTESAWLHQIAKTFTT